MLDGAAVSGWALWDLRWPSDLGARSLQVAHPHSTADPAAAFFMCSLPWGGNQLLLWRLSGDRQSAPSLSRTAITTTPYYAIGENIGQPGTAPDLDGGDARVLNVVYNRGKVYATLTTDPWNNGAAAGFYLTRLDTEAASVDWTVVGRSASGAYYFYPAVTLCGGWSSAPALAVYLSWTWPTENQWASGAVKLFTTQPPSDVTAPVNVVSGLGRFDNQFPGGNRWGDYTGAAFDWSTGNVWGAVSYADLENWWKTWIDARLLCQPTGGIPIFSNGFESAATTAWSKAVP